MLRDGMTDGEGRLLIDDVTGENMNKVWLIGKLKHKTKKELNKDIELVSSLMVAQRVVEKMNKKVEDWIDEMVEKGEITLTKDEIKKVIEEMGELSEEDINRITSYSQQQISGQGAGFLSDYGLSINLLKEIAALKNGTKEQRQHYNNLMESARRYRVMSEASMDYMVEKGRLSKKYVDEVKDKNRHYVAMKRIRNMHLGYREETEKDKKLRKRGMRGGASGSLGRTFKMYSM